MDDFLPECAGVDFLAYQGVGGVDRVLLHEGFAVAHTLHEFVCYFDADVGTGYFTLFQFGVDELFGVGVLDADAEHEGAAATALCHLAGGVAVAFHERNDAGGGEGAVFDRAATGTDVGEVVSHTATAFHELDLFLVYFHDAAVGVAVTTVADNKAVGQGDDLEVVADARHGAALGDDIAEVLEQFVDGFFRHGVGVVVLYAGKFRGQTMVHHVGVELIDFVFVAKGIFVHPDVGGKFVASKVFDG